MLFLGAMIFSSYSDDVCAQNFSGQNYHARINHYFYNHWAFLRSIYLPQAVAHRIDSSDYGYTYHFYQREHPGTPKTKAQFMMRCVLNSKFLLPYQQDAPEKANIIFTYKSENLKYISLITSFFDENENTLLSDTMLALDNNEWRTCSKELSIKGSRYFNLELIAEGIDSTYSHREYRMGDVDSVCSQNLWIEEIDIEFDGRSYRHLSERNILPACEINTQELIALENEKSFALIPELKEKRIIAFGESLFGTEALPELFVQAAKYAVKQEHCRLILVDMDMSMTLMFNGFIHGHEEFDIDSLLYENRYLTPSYHQLKELLLFLKEHNQTTDKKVWLMGIDFSPWILPNINAAKYLYAINENHHYNKIDTLCYYLVTKFDNMVKINFQPFENDIWFHEMLSETELKLFSLCFQSYMNLPLYIFMDNDYYIKRERWMYENAKNFINLICGEDKDSKVLIYGQNNQINYKTYHFCNSFGDYMKDFYGDQYSNICMSVNDGYFWANDYENKKIIVPISKNDNSMETMLSNISNDCIYVPVQAIKVPHISMKNQPYFWMITPSSHFDALIYKRRTDAAILWPGIIDTNFDFFSIILQTKRNLYEKLIEKIEPF